MQSIGMVFCKNKVSDLFQVLEREGLGFLRSDDDLGLLYRVFPDRTLEWALAGDYRNSIVGILKRFSSSFNTSVSLLYTGSPDCHAVVNFVLTGKRGVYAFPMAELTPNSDSFVVPMNVTDFARAGGVIGKGAWIRAQFGSIPTERGEIITCLLWIDGKVTRNLEF